MKAQTGILDLTTKIRENKDIHVTSKNGEAEVKIADGLYLKHLPEGLDETMVKKLKEYDNTFYVATATVIGQDGIKAMHKDKNLTTIEATIPLLGRDTFSVGVERMKSYPKPGSKSGEKITAHGVLTTSLDTVGSRANRGAMKSLRDDLQEEAMGLFGS